MEKVYAFKALAKSQLEKAIEVWAELMQESPLLPLPLSLSFMLFSTLSVSSNNPLIHVHICLLFKGG
jgi:hypothetical protein